MQEKPNSGARDPGGEKGKAGKKGKDKGDGKGKETPKIPQGFQDTMPTGMCTKMYLYGQCAKGALCPYAHPYDKDYKRPAELKKKDEKMKKEIKQGQLFFPPTPKGFKWSNWEKNQYPIKDQQDEAKERTNADPVFKTDPWGQYGPQLQVLMQPAQLDNNALMAHNQATPTYQWVPVAHGNSSTPSLASTVPVERQGRKYEFASEDRPSRYRQNGIPGRTVGRSPSGKKNAQPCKNWPNACNDPKCNGWHPSPCHDQLVYGRCNLNAKGLCSRPHLDQEARQQAVDDIMAGKYGEKEKERFVAMSKKHEESLAQAAKDPSNFQVASGPSNFMMISEDSDEGKPQEEERTDTEEAETERKENRPITKEATAERMIEGPVNGLSRGASSSVQAPWEEERNDALQLTITPPEESESDNEQDASRGEYRRVVPGFFAQ